MSIPNIETSRGVIKAMHTENLIKIKMMPGTFGYEPQRKTVNIIMDYRELNDLIIMLESHLDEIKTSYDELNEY